MQRAHSATIWEAAVMAAAVLAAASLAPTMLALLALSSVALGVGLLFCDLRPRAIDGAALALIALVWAVAGVEPALLTALGWRACAETRGWSQTRQERNADPAIATLFHRWVGITAALVWRASESPIVGWALVVFVLVIWLDWVIRRLAEWRLGEINRADHAAAAQQVILVAMLVASPTTEAALAAMTAMMLARKARAPGRLPWALQARR